MPQVWVCREDNHIVGVFCTTGCKDSYVKNSNSLVGVAMLEELPTTSVVNDVHPEQLEKYLLARMCCDTCGDNIYDALA